MVINSGSTFDDYFIYIIDGQNITQIQQYKQLNITNKWNPCIPMSFSAANYDVYFVFNKFINFRDWYPLQICDYPYNSINYINKYLFDGGNVLSITNLNINNYIINDNTNYPIARNKGFQLFIYNGTFINISSVTTNPLFYSESHTNKFGGSFFSVISAEIVFYQNVKLNFVYMLFLSIADVLFHSYVYIYIYRIA